MGSAFGQLAARRERPAPHLRQRLWEERVPALCQTRRLHKEVCVRIDGLSSLCRLCGSLREACKSRHSSVGPRQRIQMSVVFYAVRCYRSPGESRPPGADKHVLCEYFALVLEQLVRECKDGCQTQSIKATKRLRTKKLDM